MMRFTPSRRLIWVPIVHSQADLGSMGEAVRQRYIREIGRGQWDRHVEAVKDFWQSVRERIGELDLTYDRVRLYQDGLPHCGRELAIVRELAADGSPNYEILLELIERGAHLMGTESPELLLEEYRLAQQSLGSRPAQRNGPGPSPRAAQDLLDRRDRFIAGRIQETLQAGETGLLFLGMLHSLDGKLPADIDVSRLTASPSRPAPQNAAGKAPQRRKPK